MRRSIGTLCVLFTSAGVVALVVLVFAGCEAPPASPGPLVRINLDPSSGQLGPADIPGEVGFVEDTPDGLVASSSNSPVVGADLITATSTTASAAPSKASA